MNEPSPRYKESSRKKLSSAAVIVDEQGRILLVDPVYKARWDLPGGVVEEGEDPQQALLREIHEELGAEADIGRLLCVDYISKDWEGMEVVIFLFNVTLLTPHLPSAISNEEIRTTAFLPLDRALTLVTGRMKLRLESAWRAMSGAPVEFLHTSQVLD